MHIKMSKISVEPIPEDDIGQIDLDVIHLYSTMWIDVLVVFVLLVAIFKVIKRLK